MITDQSGRVLTKNANDQPFRWSFGVRPPSKWAKAVYIPHSSLPQGWTFYDNGKDLIKAPANTHLFPEKGQVFFRNAAGKFIKNRRYALQGDR